MYRSTGLVAIVLLATGLATKAGALTATIDNERVTVWDVVLGKGQSGPPTPDTMDTVVLFLEGGTIQTVGKDGHRVVKKRDFGDAVFVPRGASARDTLIEGTDAHEVVIGLKDYASPAVANLTGYPLAFPRPGSVKVFENDRIVVWHYTWKAGAPTSMHFHNKDVVVAYRYDGVLKSIPPSGAAVLNSCKAGDIRFNKADRSHSEELVEGQESAVMMELK